MKRDFLLTLLASALAKLLADEVKEWAAWLPNILIRWAARRFPCEQRDRVEEEWLAHANDLPGNLAKLSHALGCVATAVRATNALAEAAAIVFLPVFALTFAAFFALDASRIWMFGPVWYYKDLPEAMRARRLQSAAGGLAVLGLDKLDLVVADFALLLARSQPPPRAVAFLVNTKVLRRMAIWHFVGFAGLPARPTSFIPGSNSSQHQRARRYFRAMKRAGTKKPPEAEGPSVVLDTLRRSDYPTAGSCAVPSCRGLQWPGSLDPLAFARRVNGCPEIGPPLHVQPEIGAVAEHTRKDERGRRGDFAAAVAQLINMLALHAHRIGQCALREPQRLHEFFD